MKFLQRYFKNVKAEKRTIRHLDTTMEAMVRKQHFHNSAMHSTKSLISPVSHGQPSCVVSLTTYSKRIHDVYVVIESLGEQTIKANKIVLWLDENEFCLDSIPELLKKQMDRGLDVRFYQNIRSYKKLIPSLKLFPESDIITVDDDFIYPHDFIEILVKESRANLNCIVGVRSHTIAIEGGQPLPYKKWDYESSFAKNGSFTFLTTGAGTLFPAHILNDEFCNEDEFMNLCPSADDVWINFMCIKYGIERKKVHDDRVFRSRFISLDAHQDIALNKENVHKNQNDEQIKRVVDRYSIKF